MRAALMLERAEPLTLEDLTPRALGAAVTRTWALEDVNLALDALRRGDVIRSVLRP